MAAFDNEKKLEPIIHIDGSNLAIADIINVSGHVQELDRRFGTWSTCMMGVMVDNAWAAGAGTLVVALYNGGGPGVLYGLIAATIFYCFIGACLAELASAIPSSASVYHWAAITPGPRYGRICSWYAGWWNCLAWIFACASASLIAAESIMSLWTLYHPEFQPQRWQTFIAYLGVCIINSSFVLFGQHVIAKMSTAVGVTGLALGLATVIICAVYPSQTGYGYASHEFVWIEWQNLTGWSSDGFVFLAGMLNGAFAIGTPDGVSHICEELPRPGVNIPRGIAAQILTGFVSCFAVYIAVLYGVTSFEDVINSQNVSFPLAAMYQQVTRSRAGTTVLLLILLVDMVLCLTGCWITTSRILWALGRDNATPCSEFIGKISPRWRNPFNAQLACTVCVIALGCIYIGSQTAFNAFAGVFIIFTTMSYLMAILPHLITGRRHVKPGPFWIPRAWGSIVFSIACLYIIIFDVIFLFPYSKPVSAETMNWGCVLFGGFTALLSLLYVWKRKHGYIGPMVALDAKNEIMSGLIGLDRKFAEERRAMFG